MGHLAPHLQPRPTECSPGAKIILHAWLLCTSPRQLTALDALSNHATVDMSSMLVPSVHHWPQTRATSRKAPGLPLPSLQLFITTRNCMQRAGSAAQTAGVRTHGPKTVGKVEQRYIWY